MRWFGDRALLNTPLTNVTLRGTPVAAVQNVFNFTFACVFPAELVCCVLLGIDCWAGRRVYGAGHEVVSRVYVT